MPLAFPLRGSWVQRVSLDRDRGQINTADPPDFQLRCQNAATQICGGREMHYPANERGNSSRDSMKIVAIFIGALVFIALAPRRLAQDNYEIQVYGYETVEPDHTMFELHSNFTFDGATQITDGVLPTNHAARNARDHPRLHRLVRGRASTPSLRRGAAHGWHWVGDHLRPRTRARKLALAGRRQPLERVSATSGGNPSADTWTCEIRPIVDKKLGQLVLVVQSHTRPLVPRPRP